MPWVNGEKKGGGCGVYALLIDPGIVDCAFNLLGPRTMNSDDPCVGQ